MACMVPETVKTDLRKTDRRQQQEREVRSVKDSRPRPQTKRTRAAFQKLGKSSEDMLKLVTKGAQFSVNSCSISCTLMQPLYRPSEGVNISSSALALERPLSLLEGPMSQVGVMTAATMARVVAIVSSVQRSVREVTIM